MLRRLDPDELGPAYDSVQSWYQTSLQIAKQLQQYYPEPTKIGLYFTEL